MVNLLVNTTAAIDVQCYFWLQPKREPCFSMAVFQQFISDKAVTRKIWCRHISSHFYTISMKVILFLMSSWDFSVSSARVKPKPVCPTSFVRCAHARIIQSRTQLGWMPATFISSQNSWSRLVCANGWVLNMIIPAHTCFTLGNATWRLEGVILSGEERKIVRDTHEITYFVRPPATHR